MPTCTRRLTFCAGHRVFGHESKCAHPHGHNYVAEITVEAALDSIGRVIDFSVIKEQVGGWIEANWDHAFLVFEGDHEMMAVFEEHPEWRMFILIVNPTVENLAQVLLAIASDLLAPNGVKVTRVRLHETENCYADAY